MTYHCFFVEDEYMVRENVMSSQIWQSSEFRLSGEASNGEDALRLMQETSVDILITDIRMPFMDGLELASYVTEQMPQIKIIILSGYDDFKYAQRALQLGVSEYLTKPLKSSDLLLSLQKVSKEIEAERRLLQSIQQLQDFHDDRQPDQYDHLISSAKKYILIHYKNPNLSLKEVAAFINISPSYFSALFRKETGETFIDFLTYLRIDRAKSLLKTSSRRSTEIAYEVGYNDPNYFSKLFKKIVGLTPKEYRVT